MKIVSNSTALVHLSAAGQLDLLRDLFDSIHVPDQVYDEAVFEARGKPGEEDLEDADWLKIHTATHQLALEILMASWGGVEAACIELAMELNADIVILDDEEVRLNAQVLEIQYTSTAGILLWAGRLRRLDFPEALDELLATGYRLQPKEYKRLMSEWQAWKKSE